MLQKNAKSIVIIYNTSWAWQYRGRSRRDRSKIIHFGDRTRTGIFKYYFRMNGTAPFRSHLMQQFAAMARTQSRPPIALLSMGSNTRDYGIASTNNNEIEFRIGASGPRASCHRSSSISQSRCCTYDASRNNRFSSKQSCGEQDEPTETPTSTPTKPVEDFQNTVKGRRTISNFLSSPSTIDLEQTMNTSDFLRAAIKRGVQCARAGPNHKLTEPTTFYQIISPSASSEKLLNIVHDVTLQRLQKQKLSGEEACRTEAMRKREKWANIPAFVVATVSGMEDQAPPTRRNNDEIHSFSEMAYIPPSSTRQLEDYAATCASIQNLLLSLHSEGLGSKWATGPVIRTLAFRELIGCKPNEMVVGLIFIGWPKRVPRVPRRRRELDGNVLREL